MWGMVRSVYVEEVGVCVLCVFSRMIMRKGKKDAQNIRRQGWR